MGLEAKAKGKSMFKKPKKRKVMNKRKIELEDDTKDSEAQPSFDTERRAEDDADVNVDADADTSILSKIQSVKKTRKIKNLHRALKQKQSKHNKKDGGGDGGNDDEEEKLLAEANQDLKQRLEGTFAAKGGSTNDEDGNVLTRKHKLAMEQYISSQMKDKEPAQENGNGDVEEGGKIGEHGDSEVKNTAALYAHILQQTTEAGMKDTDPNKEEGDIGAGGAMLGGTGIAEVALPIDDRIRTARETELAAARLEASRRRQKSVNSSEPSHQSNFEDLTHSLPMSFGAGPSKQKAKRQRYNSSQSNAITASISSNVSSSQRPTVTARDIDILSKSNPVGSSYAHNFRLHNEEWISNQRKLEAESRTQTDQGEDNEIDSSRVGFEAKRGLKSTFNEENTGGGGQKLQRASDDRAYKKFVTREFKHGTRR